MIDINLLKWTQSTINTHISSFVPPADMRQSVSQIKQLPPLSATAKLVLQLASDPFADARKLSEIIELDPLLTTQVIRWANSALYGYKGKINSVKDAISIVLGFDFVLNFTLGLATLTPLKAPTKGIIGTRSLWIQSLASTRLMSAIAQKMPVVSRPEPQTLFLAGLIHNVGFLLLGHEFDKEYSYLNKLIDANPKQTINTIENFTFGCDHAQLGAWLMQSWSMPKSIVDIVYHHHNPHYRGDNYHLNLLVFLNDYLLSTIGIGDAANQECPDIVFEQLKVKKTDCEQQLDSLIQEIESIKSSVDALS